MVVVDKKKKTCKINDSEVRAYRRIEDMKKEKMNLQKIWNARVQFMPLVLGPLGAKSKKFWRILKVICIKT